MHHSLSADGCFRRRPSSSSRTCFTSPRTVDKDMATEESLQSFLHPPKRHLLRSLLGSVVARLVFTSSRLPTKRMPIVLYIDSCLLSPPGPRPMFASAANPLDFAPDSMRILSYTFNFWKPSLHRSIKIHPKQRCPIYAGAGPEIWLQFQLNNSTVQFITLEKPFLVSTK
ncbi:uncharacterized protein UV8b_04026 [Ustilaginoidea virens]|uniref:Uncharacterized protein n=1 Tax=Ustilaginoidea virens TaxID=1159556 RepID=A0A8E5HR17_USTVR|nr:uncharacterized protein UV8b_04026 [Ustilaginoidea virens]QUC19785.1 hypothetical protein UV8b_04026 [Ustilaginoidea virens]